MYTENCIKMKVENRIQWFNGEMQKHYYKNHQNCLGNI